MITHEKTVVSYPTEFFDMGECFETIESTKIELKKRHSMLDELSELHSAIEACLEPM